MAYDEELDARIRHIVGRWEQTEGKRMFGGVCNLAEGRMFAASDGTPSSFRSGENAAVEAMRSPSVRPF